VSTHANGRALLEGRAAVVTGGASGIGLATAERFVHEGARVALVDRQAETGQVARRLGGDSAGVYAVVADLSTTAGGEQAIADAMTALGGLDVLVNGVGIAGRSIPLWDLEDADWDDMMAITLRSVFVCTRAALRHMVPARSGAIVNIASVAGKEGNPNAVAYSTAKAGVIALTKAAAKEVARAGIRINAVAPGLIETPMNAQVSPEHLQYMLERMPMGRIGRPEEVAALITFLASDEASFTTGQVYDISGGRATY
jgi:3-oxoacyl-[acyl-carrier protein] reductase